MCNGDEMCSTYVLFMSNGLFYFRKTLMITTLLFDIIFQVSEFFYCVEENFFISKSCILVKIIIHTLNILSYITIQKMNKIQCNFVSKFIKPFKKIVKRFLCSGEYLMGKGGTFFCKRK